VIAPLKETGRELDANRRLLARARRAVATALLRQSHEKTFPQQVSGWHAALLAIWTLIAALSCVGLWLGWWKLPNY
jgi:hypothetical protein